MSLAFKGKNVANVAYNGNKIEAIAHKGKWIYVDFYKKNYSFPSTNVDETTAETDFDINQTFKEYNEPRPWKMRPNGYISAGTMLVIKDTTGNLSSHSIATIVFTNITRDQWQKDLNFLHSHTPKKFYLFVKNVDNSGYDFYIASDPVYIGIAADVYFAYAKSSSKKVGDRMAMNDPTFRAIFRVYYRES